MSNSFSAFLGVKRKFGRNMCIAHTHIKHGLVGTRKLFFNLLRMISVLHLVSPMETFDPVLASWERGPPLIGLLFVSVQGESLPSFILI